MELRCSKSTTWENKALKRRQLGIHSIDPLLQRICVVGIKGSVLELSLVLFFICLSWCSNMSANVDKTGLDVLELPIVVEYGLRVFFICALHGRVVVARQTKVSIELVNGAEGLEDSMVFSQSISREQHRCALVTCLGVNLESLPESSHRSSQSERVGDSSLVSQSE